MPDKEKLTWMRARRDTKAKPHLEQYAPVWIVEEMPVVKDDTLFFNVAFYHPYYGWVNRRYRFDAFNSVLYHQGQTRFDETAALALFEKEPYLTADMINTVGSYGG